MADDSKNLSDDLNDMLDDAKDSAKKTGDNISNSAKEFSNSAQHSANEFSKDANKALGDGKNIAIIAHITLIGWIIALVMNNDKKTELGSFYIRQVLGIMLLGLVCSFIPLINLVAWILLLVMWIMSLISALNGEEKPVFLLGKQFQEWFKGL